MHRGGPTDLGTIRYSSSRRSRRRLPSLPPKRRPSTATAGRRSGNFWSGRTTWKSYILTRVGDVRHHTLANPLRYPERAFEKGQRQIHHKDIEALRILNLDRTSLCLG